MPISVTYDAERQRALYKVAGPVTGREVITSAMERRRANPALLTCDKICDLTQYTGDVTADEMFQVAMAANADRPPDAPHARTAFVTTDPYFSDWARVLSHQFKGREFRVFASVEGAQAWMAQRVEVG